MPKVPSQKKKVGTPFKSFLKNQECNEPKKERKKDPRNQDKNVMDPQMFVSFQKKDVFF